MNITKTVAAILLTSASAFSAGMDGFSGGFLIGTNRVSTTSTYTNTSSPNLGKEQSSSHWNIVDATMLIRHDARRTIQGNYPIFWARISMGTSSGIKDDVTLDGLDSAGDVAYSDVESMDMMSAHWNIGFPWQFIDRSWIKAGTGLAVNMDLSAGMGITDVDHANTSGAGLHSFADIVPLNLLVQNDWRMTGEKMTHFEVAWRPFGGGFGITGEFTDQWNSDAMAWGVGIAYVGLNWN